MHFTYTTSRHKSASLDAHPVVKFIDFLMKEEFENSKLILQATALRGIIQI